MRIENDRIILDNKQEGLYLIKIINDGEGIIPSPDKVTTSYCSIQEEVEITTDDEGNIINEEFKYYFIIYDRVTSKYV